MVFFFAQKSRATGAIGTQLSLSGGRKNARFIFSPERRFCAKEQPGAPQIIFLLVGIYAKKRAPFCLSSIPLSAKNTAEDTA